MAVTKADIVDALYGKLGFSKKEAGDLVELVFDSLKATLSKGQKVKISGFGNFVVREKRSRVGRNPQTGESIEISARRVLTFRPSQVLRADVNHSLENKPIQPDSARPSSHGTTGPSARSSASSSDPEQE
jgi:integration host factor subunit alpha